jgi:hypothetical protein
MRLKLKFIFLPLLLLLLGCNSKKEHAVNFYYWKSQVDIGATEKKYFDALQAETLYLRVFDVDDEGNGAIAKGKIEAFHPATLNATYVPVVFITNRTFVNKSEKDAELLSTKIFKLIEEICSANGIKSYSEIQIDCDWTGSTRAGYFSFLKSLKQLSHKQLSSTIRLHQIKFRKTTGVPPVDKGYAMCYATTSPKDTTVANSILDIKVLKDYLKNVNDYPVQLDMALPLYSWAVVTNHLGKIKLLNGVTKNELDSTNFEQTAPNRYRVRNDVSLHGMYLNIDFTIRTEEITPQLLKQTKEFLNKHIRNEFSIVYYHLDRQFLEKYTIQDLK